MQQEQTLPDEERRSKLSHIRSNLKVALDHISPDESEVAGVEARLREADSEISAAIEEVESKLNDIPQWDSELVRDLVLDNADRRDTTTERVDGEVVLRFEVGEVGDKTECRYATAVTTGNEWFHVRRDGDWDEVWRN